MSEQFTAQQLAILDKLRKDDQYFAKHCLKIKTDEGIVAFEYNIVQIYLHHRAEDQKRRTGKVRRVGVKARQQGFSEFVSGRGYKFAIMQRAKTVYILSHESSSTQTLFAKVDRYHRYCPEVIKPKEVASNRNQKKFDNESEYTVGTAGSENTGRGNTVQFGHLSEPAHYDNDEGIKAGLLQTISDAPGTEIWWETTANGKNWFYDWCMKIVAGETEYELDFIPWFWTAKYATEAPPNFERTDEEEDLAACGTMYDPVARLVVNKPLTNDQLFWRRRKMASLGDRLFKQEFPATLEEAFQATGDSFHSSTLVAKAQRSIIKAEPISPYIIGVDPGRNRDRTVIAHRIGREIVRLDKYDDMDTMRLSGIIINLFNEFDIDRCFVDWGMGHGTIDRLRELGYDRVEGINFGQSPNDPVYYNKRAEMIFEFDKWLKDGEVNLPDDPDMAADLALMPQPEYSSNGKIKFPSKDDIREVARRSPDIADAIYLTFAEKVRRYIPATETGRTQNTRRGSALSTLRNRRGELEQDEVSSHGSFRSDSVRSSRRGIRSSDRS